MSCQNNTSRDFHCGQGWFTELPVTGVIVRIAGD
jgi:hypothetical protein